MSPRLNGNLMWSLAFLAITAWLPLPPFNTWYAQSLPEFNLRTTAGSAHAGHVNDGRSLVD